MKSGCSGIGRAPRRLRPHVVGTPGMAGMATSLGRGLEIRQGSEVMALRETNAGWTVTLAGGMEIFDRVVVTVPAPQLSNVLGPEHPMSREVAGLRLDPCLTFMAAFDPNTPRPFVTHTADADRTTHRISDPSSLPLRQTKSNYREIGSTDARPHSLPLVMTVD
jgi:renalase